MQKLVCRILFFVCSLIGYDAFSQGWEKTYGGDEYESAKSVVQTTDSGYLTVGDSYSLPGSGTNDVYLVKTDPNGNVLWEKFYGGDSSDNGYSIEKVNNGYVVAGYAASFGGPAGYLLKVDENGAQIWARTFPKKIFRTVKRTSDGGLIIGGEGWDENGNTDMYLVKTDASGSPQWEKNFGNAQKDDYGRAAIQTDDGGFVLVGEKRGAPNGSVDVYLVKTDEAGSLEWEKLYGGDDWDFGNDVKQTCDGGFIITGISDEQATERDIFLVKTNKKGELEWSKRFGGPKHDHGNCVIQTIDGGYLITGNNQEEGTDDLTLIKTNEDGNFMWEKKYGGASTDIGYDILETADGEYLIAGATLSFNGDVKGYEAYLIKTDGLGILVKECKPSGPLEAKLYPNPFRFSTTFELTGKQSLENVRLILFDIAGKFISSGIFQGPVFEFLGYGLPTGIYFFQIQVGSSTVVNGKLMIF